MAIAGVLTAIVLNRADRATAQATTPSLTAPRFSAAWTDGRRNMGELTGWDRPDGVLSFDGQPLFVGEPAVRWLRNAQIIPQQAFECGVELVGGDFFPGDVTELAPRSEHIAAGEPYLLIQPAVSVDLPGTPRRQTVPINTQWVKRIVWSPREDNGFQPQTAFLRDGRRLRFRAIHWLPDGARLLEDNKIETVRLKELAELHLAGQEMWPAYLRLLAVLSPDCRGRIVRLEGSSGIKITTSWERLRPWSLGHNRSAANALCIVQPAWTTDGLAIPIEQIERITVFSPEEIPLTTLAPARSESRGFVFAGPQPMRVNASVLGSSLCSGGGEYAWGMGVHAGHLLEFELPSLARRIETWVGLDEMAKDGGCARGRIEIVPQVPLKSSTEARESPLLIGSRQTPARLQLALPGSIPPKTRLRFIADAVPAERPRGADPLEVRDFLDWLEPLLILDRDQLVRVVRERLQASVPELAGWSCAGEWQTVSQWRPGGRPLPGFRREILIGGEPLLLSQELQISRERSRLLIRASRLLGKSSPVDLQIRINERSVAKVEVPIAEDTAEPVPIIVDLAEFSGTRVNLGLEFRGRGRQAMFEFLGANLHGQP
jgi:hypothetical protein